MHIYAHTHVLQAIDEGAKAESQWKADLEAYAAKYPAEAAEFKVGGVLVCLCGVLCARVLPAFMIYVLVLACMVLFACVDVILFLLMRRCS